MLDEPILIFTLTNIRNTESNVAWLIIQPPSFSESIARYGLYWIFVVVLTVNFVLFYVSTFI